MDPSPTTPLLCRVINRTHLDLFFPQSEAWETTVRLSDAIEARNSAFLVIQDVGIVCAGGYDAKYSAFVRDTFLIGMERGDVRVLPYLSSPRCGVGLCFSLGQIYAFGGRDVKLGTTCEKLRISDQEWTQVPGMNSPRAYFNPVEWQADIYLCGGLTQSCEVFSLSTELFSSVPFLLPETTESITLLDHSCLLVFTSRYRSCWSLERHAPGEREEMRVDCCKTSCGPVRWQGIAYMVSEGKAWKVDGKCVEMVGLDVSTVN